MKKVLVIEDNGEEKVKARKAIESAGYYCYVAEDLHEALLLLGQEDEAKEIEGKSTINLLTSKIKWDGIITDLHFPISPGEFNEAKPEPYGLEIVILANELGIPCVICTDVNHHFSRWIERVAKRLGVAVVIEKGQGWNAWEKAVKLLEKKGVKDE